MKRTISILLSAMFLIASCSCAKKEETTTALASETKTSETTTEVETTTEMETTTTETPVPTEHIDNVGDVRIIDHISPSNENLKELRCLTCNYFVQLGYDNPYLLEDARNYFKLPDASIEELGYLQPEKMNESESFGTVNGYLYDCSTHYDFGLVRYILAQNGLRFMIDEIPYSFFEQYYPDYLEYYKSGTCPEDNIVVDWELFNKYNMAFTENDYTSILNSFLNENSSESNEAMRLSIFEYLRRYNSYRYYIATLNSDEIGFIPMARAVDGRNVLAPTRFRYSQLQSEVNKFPRCENIDISTPETYEDLVNSGVDVELMEEVFHYSGIDIPSLSQGENTTKNSTETEMEKQTT